MIRIGAGVFYLVLVTCLVLAGCGDDDPDQDLTSSDSPEEIQGVQVHFALADGKGFYDFPFPTDLRRKSDGSGLDLSGYPRGGAFPFADLANDYIRLAAKCKGFNPSTVCYFRFDAPIRQSSLPDLPLDALEPDSAVFIVDIDPSSGEYGRRFPLRVRFYTEAKTYQPSNLLALTPLPGFVLRPNTKYAAVVLRALADEDGDPLGSPLALQQVLYGQAPGGTEGTRARRVYRVLADFLREKEIPPSSVAAATVFTTGDPVGDTARVYDHVVSLPVPSLFRPLEKTREYDTYYVLEASFIAPQYQQGTPPYLFGGGQLVFDPNGLPVKQREEEIPIALAIPKGPMPAEGWPLVIYIHGTGGVSTQLVDRGRWSAPDQTPPEGTGPALTFAWRGIATAGSALPVHPQRTGLLEGIDFYNILQPPATRDNMRQGMGEQALFLRLLQQLTIDPLLCPATDPSLAGDGRIRFDPRFFFSMGQSLGSMVLDIWAAFEENLSVVIPSGTGGHYASAALEMRGIPFIDFLRFVLAIPEDEEMDIFDPFLNALMLAWGSIDPIHYAGHYYQQPLPGRNPKHVFMTQGFYDSYYTPPSQNAFILAAGLQLAGDPFPSAGFDRIAQGYGYDSPRCGDTVPCSRSTVEAMNMTGLEVASYPVAGNLASQADSPVTGVVVEALEDGNLDGHHVNYQLDELKFQYGCFLRTFIDTGMPVLLEPNELSASCE